MTKYGIWWTLTKSSVPFSLDPSNILCAKNYLLPECWEDGGRQRSKEFIKALSMRDYKSANDVALKIKNIKLRGIEFIEQSTTNNWKSNTYLQSKVKE